MEVAISNVLYYFLISLVILQDNWRGIPTRLNNIPHSREIRKYFYDDVLQATQRAINDGRTRLKVWFFSEHDFPLSCDKSLIHYQLEHCYKNLTPLAGGD